MSNYLVSVCGENEYIPLCVPCPPLNCGDRTDLACTLQCIENSKCYCQLGYLRAPNGTCVKEELCCK